VCVCVCVCIIKCSRVVDQDGGDTLTAVACLACLFRWQGILVPVKEIAWIVPYYLRLLAISLIEP
jgi:hypothetical protein